jgi:cytochrome c oxidase assembly factor CtaG
LLAVGAALYTYRETRRPMVAIAAPLLHEPGLDDGVVSAWHVDPALGTLLIVAAVAYGSAYRSTSAAGRAVPPWWQVGAYAGGLVSLALALMGPPHHFSEVSFAAHMVQHLLMTLVAAPLIVLGRPVQVLLRGLGARRSGAVLRPTIGRPIVRQILGMIAHPVSVVVLFNGAMLLWHLPSLYEAAVRNRLLHDVEHASFFGTALLFWWVLIDPVPRHHRFVPSTALLVLFASWMIGDLLGAALTLAREPLYPLYARAPNPWGLDPVVDQSRGGAIMWIGAGVLFAACMLGILATSHARPGPRRHAAQRPRGAHGVGAGPARPALRRRR